MLKMIRNSKFFTVFLLCVIIFVISIAFVLTGVMGPQGQSSKSVVAEVDNKEITVAEYKRTYSSIQESTSQVLSEDEIKKLDLRNIVINRLINEKILLIAAEDAGLRVSEEELQEEWQEKIRNMPVWEGGVFNEKVYEKLLRFEYHMTPVEFVDEVRNEVLFKKIFRLIGETAEVTDYEKKLIDSLKGNKALLTENFLNPKRESLVMVYVETLKRQMKITIKEELMF